LPIGHKPLPPLAHHLLRRAVGLAVGFSYVFGGLLLDLTRAATFVRRRLRPRRDRTAGLALRRRVASSRP